MAASNIIFVMEYLKQLITWFVYHIQYQSETSDNPEGVYSKIQNGRKKQK